MSVGDLTASYYDAAYFQINKMNTVFCCVAAGLLPSHIVGDFTYGLQVERHLVKGTNQWMLINWTHTLITV